MLKKRISVLLSLLMVLLIMPATHTMANSYVNKTIVVPALPYEVTTKDALYMHVNVRNQTTPATLILSLLGGYFTIEDDVYVGAKNPVYDDNGNEIDLTYILTNPDGLMIQCNTSASAINLPIICTANEENVFAYLTSITPRAFEDGQMCCLRLDREATEVTTGPSIAPDRGDFASSERPSSSSSSPTIAEIRANLIKSKLKPANVSYTNIAKDTDEYNMINSLAAKGVIAQDKEQTVFDLNKQLSTADTLTYLSKLLAADNATKEKLSENVISKYFDQKAENYDYLAAVGSMMTEPTLKAVSESKDMSRELLAQVLSEITDIKADQKDIPFTDISTSKYQAAIKHCYDAGLLIGTTDTTMSPEATVTNGQMLQVLDRLDQALSKKEDK